MFKILSNREEIERKKEEQARLEEKLAREEKELAAMNMVLAKIQRLSGQLERHLGAFERIPDDVLANTSEQVETLTMLAHRRVYDVMEKISEEFDPGSATSVENLNIFGKASMIAMLLHNAICKPWPRFFTDVAEPRVWQNCRRV